MADLIDRQAAIDAIQNHFNPQNEEMPPEIAAVLAGVGVVLEHMPSAQPERKVGKWTEKKVLDDSTAIKEWQSARCSACGKYHTTPYMYYFNDFDYCPNCGARMEAKE